MNDNDRLTLIDKLIQMIASYHNTMGKKLSTVDKQQVYKCDYDTYNYEQDSILKPVSVYNFMFKTFNEICNGIIQLIHQSPYYQDYEKRITTFIDVLAKNNIQPDKFLIGTTHLNSKYIEANTRLTYFTSGNMQYHLAELAKRLFTF